MTRRAAIIGAVLVALAIAGEARAQSLSDIDTSRFDERTSEYKAQAHTDPFASGVSAAEDLSIEDLQLTGIVYQDANEAFALISGYLVKPGDRIAGYRVDKIEADKVRLKRIDEIFILALGGGI